MENQIPTTEKDKHLWKLAKKRVAFRNHLFIYLACNAFLWGVWHFTGKHDGEDGIPWPIFPTLGWGFGLFFHFMGTYINTDDSKRVEREYEKLKRKQGE